jgi:hypothetical protein
MSCPKSPWPKTPPRNTRATIPCPRFSPGCSRDTTAPVITRRAVPKGQTLATLKEALDGLKAQSVGPPAPVEGSPERAALDERIQDLQRRIRDRERRLAGASARSEQPDP